VFSRNADDQLQGGLFRRKLAVGSINRNLAKALTKLAPQVQTHDCSSHHDSKISLSPVWTVDSDRSSCRGAHKSRSWSLRIEEGPPMQVIGVVNTIRSYIAGRCRTTRFLGFIYLNRSQLRKGYRTSLMAKCRNQRQVLNTEASRTIKSDA
jgi:hypothetical protein